ncbi:MAG: hypothetical protein NZ651_02480 [Candidatus Bipolaricaulota bacterium]|nr:hypothetical protein [Candidatus Bipolaricaulota bacterium]MDW8126623.1 hypothetical protein [Candidatus Bipolaricaulota bacterium]
MLPTTVLLFDRGGLDLVARVRTASAKSVVECLRNLEQVEEIVIATGSPAAWEGVPCTVALDPPGEWHFGARFDALIAQYHPQRVLYLASGAGLLFTEADWHRILQADLGAPFAVLNNFYSTDLALIVPPWPVPDLTRDNPLGMRLWQAGYSCYELPRCAATQLDIDTPGELQILALHPELPPAVREALAEVPTTRAKALLEAIVDPEAEVLLLGRVSGHLLRFLDQEAACRFRVVSEERGMEASGRAERGAVFSLLGSWAEHMSPSSLVRTLSKLGDVVIWDIRVLMGHFGIWPPPEERYACDLLRYEKVRDPRLRELVQACAESPTPFLLGGHSLVSGGMYLAVELAWRNRDREPRFRPLPFGG